MIAASTSEKPNQTKHQIVELEFELSRLPHLNQEGEELSVDNETQFTNRKLFVAKRQELNGQYKLYDARRPPNPLNYLTIKAELGVIELVIICNLRTVNTSYGLSIA